MNDKSRLESLLADVESIRMIATGNKLEDNEGAVQARLRQLSADLLAAAMGDTTAESLQRATLPPSTTGATTDSSIEPSEESRDIVPMETQGKKNSDLLSSQSLMLVSRTGAVPHTAALELSGEQPDHPGHQITPATVQASSVRQSLHHITLSAGGPMPSLLSDAQMTQLEGHNHLRVAATDQHRRIGTIPSAALRGYEESRKPHALPRSHEVMSVAMNNHATAAAANDTDRVGMETSEETGLDAPLIVQNHRDSVDPSSARSNGIVPFREHATELWSFLVHWRALAVLVTSLLVFVVYGERGCRLHDASNGAGSSNPLVQRFDSVLHCAAKLSPDSSHSQLGDPDNIHSEAALWFLGPAGRSVEVPLSESQCTWDSAFGQYYALLVVRGSLGVPDASWYSKRRVEEQHDSCHWARVTCDDQNRISALILNNANLTGSIPAELAGLVHLTNLELYSNPQVTGLIPSELSGLASSLEHLKLQGTGLYGKIPTELGELTSLRELRLDHTHLSGDMPEEICRLKLEHLTADSHGENPRVHCKCCKGL